MRQIKFRGRSLTNGKWVSGDSIKHTENASENGTDVLTYIGSRVPNARKVGAMKWVPVAPSTAGQFTGLKDRNGKEIYEGDILERYNEAGITMHIDYFGSQFGCVQHWDGVDGEGSWYPLDSYFTEEWEVIGNIHDNPELLKGEQSKS